MDELLAEYDRMKELPGWKDFGYEDELGGAGVTDPYAYARPSADQMLAHPDAAHESLEPLRWNRGSR